MNLIWETVKSELTNRGIINFAPSVLRAKVPGGWFILTATTSTGGTFFYPDSEHLWDGSSLP